MPGHNISRWIPGQKFSSGLETPSRRGLEWERAWNADGWIAHRASFIVDAHSDAKYMRTIHSGMLSCTHRQCSRHMTVQLSHQVASAYPRPSQEHPVVIKGFPRSLCPFKRSVIQRTCRCQHRTTLRPDRASLSNKVLSTLSWRS